MANDGWTPILSHGGTVYCSPRCGGKCKRRHYDHVVKAADALAGRMGAGWKPVVWENLGWHYRVEKGVVAIHPSEDRNAPEVDGFYPIRNFTVFLNSAKQFVTHAGTPEDALGFAVQDARTHIARVSADLDALFDQAAEAARA